MRGLITAVALTTFVVGGLCAAEMENPYKKAKVGDWVTYTSTTVMAGMPQKQIVTVKQTVKAKTEKEVTLLIESEMMGQKTQTESTISLVQPYDPVKAGVRPGMDVQKVAEGKESVTVAGKKYACTWYQIKMTMKQGGGNISGLTKTWVSTDVPLGGMVKSESDMEINMGGQAMKTQVTMELKDCGGAK